MKGSCRRVQSLLDCSPVIAKNEEMQYIGLFAPIYLFTGAFCRCVPMGSVEFMFVFSEKDWLSLLVFGVRRKASPADTRR